MFSGAFTGGLAAASVLAAFTLLGGPQVAHFHAGPSAVHEHFTPYESEEPAPSPPLCAAPSPEPERSEDPPSENAGSSAAAAAGVLAGVTALGGSRRIARRLRGKQPPAHRDVAVQTSTSVTEAAVQTSPFDAESSSAPPSIAASEGSPARVRRQQHGRRA